MEKEDWKPFRNALDKKDRKEFDEMFDIPKTRTSFGGLRNLRSPEVETKKTAEMKVETTAGQMRIRIITTTRRTKMMTIDLSFLSKLYRYISSSTMCEQPALLASRRLLLHHFPSVYNNR
jgi:hypothetical protein